MELIKKRVGRLNLTEFFKDGVVRKTSLIEEPSRPNRLLREALALKVADSRGVLVPKLLAYGRDSHNREYLETKSILGSSLVHVASGERYRAFATIGGQMLKLNSCFENYGWLDGRAEKGEYSSWKEFLIDFYEKYSRRITDYDLVKTISDCNVPDLIKENIPDHPESYIIHRDIKAGNVIRDDRGFIWILDWENAILGDPLFDIAQFGANFGHGMHWKALVSGYNLDVSTQIYALYESIALIGVNAFYQKYHLQVKRKRERLSKYLKIIKPS